MARGRLFLVAVANWKCFDALSVYLGTKTNAIAPQTAPVSDPVPPSTIAVTNDRLSVSEKAPGLTTPDQKPYRPPANPAHAALTTKARTLVRPTLMPAREAAISSSRTHRTRRPRPLCTRLASRTSATSAAAIDTQD